MSTPVDVGMAADAPLGPFDLDDILDTLVPSLESGHYTQLAERRSQLEDAETLRRVRAL